MHYRRKKRITKEEHRKLSKKAIRGWNTKRINGTDKWGSKEQEPRRVPVRSLLGVLTWHSVDGSVTKCVVRQALRKNQILIGDTACGWDYLTRRIRKKLSIMKATT